MSASRPSCEVDDISIRHSPFACTKDSTVVNKSSSVVHVHRSLDRDNIMLAVYWNHMRCSVEALCRKHRGTFLVSADKI